MSTTSRSTSGPSGSNAAAGAHPKLSYREATRNARPAGPADAHAHTQHHAPPVLASAPIPRKPSAAGSAAAAASSRTASLALAPSGGGGAGGAGGAGGGAGWAQGVRRPSADAGYVSSRSADALLSDVKPLSVELVTLGLLNALLDELLLSLVYAAGGLAPAKLKAALPKVLPQPLARHAVEEAELELKSWFDGEEGRVWRAVMELPLGRGREWADAFGREGAGRDAGRLMRVMTQTYSTLGDRAPNDETELAFIHAFRMKGGDIRQGILDSSALYLTAIIEYTAEYLLTALGRVMGHDGQRLSAAGVKQLWDALEEDEALWGMVGRMQVRETIKATLERQQARLRRQQAKALSQTSAAPSVASTAPSSSAAAAPSRAGSSGGNTSSPVPSVASAGAGSSRAGRANGSDGAVTPTPVPLGAVVSGAGGAAGALARDLSIWGRSSLSSTRESLDPSGTAALGPEVGHGAGAERAAPLDAINEVSASVDRYTSPPPMRSTPLHARDVNQHLSVETPASQPAAPSLASSIRSLASSRKSTSSVRPLLGLDDTTQSPGAKEKRATAYEQHQGMDEFEALLKGGGTKKMSLTPVVMKRTENQD